MGKRKFSLTSNEEVAQEAEEKAAAATVAPAVVSKTKDKELPKDLAKKIYASATESVKKQIIYLRDKGKLPGEVGLPVDNGALSKVLLWLLERLKVEFAHKMPSKGKTVDFQEIYKKVMQELPTEKLSNQSRSDLSCSISPTLVRRYADYLGGRLKDQVVREAKDQEQE